MTLVALPLAPQRPHPSRWAPLRPGRGDLASLRGPDAPSDIRDAAPATVALRPGRPWAAPGVPGLRDAMWRPSRRVLQWEDPDEHAGAGASPLSRYGRPLQGPAWGPHHRFHPRSWCVPPGSRPPKRSSANGTSGHTRRWSAQILFGRPYGTKRHPGPLGRGSSGDHSSSRDNASTRRAGASMCGAWPTPSSGTKRGSRRCSRRSS